MKMQNNITNKNIKQYNEINTNNCHPHVANRTNQTK